MPRSPYAISAVLLGLAACAQPSQSSGVSSPSSGSAAATPAAPDRSSSASPAPPTGSTSVAPVERSDADAPATDAPATIAAPGDADAGAGAAAQFRACTLDTDCVAVDRVGCCHNGWKEAVATTQKEPYAKSFTCAQTHPICPMYIVQDSRVPECDNTTHLCTMVRTEDIACMGFIKNRHACPPGYRCQLKKPGDFPGKCVKP
jgi:hypothetical protein